MDSVIVGISGGSCSGKSTFTQRLKECYKDDIAIVYQDNYYKKRDDLTLEERSKINYDHPDAFDTERLVEDILKLKEGKSIECPIYDYTIHNRLEDTNTVQPKKIIVLEGILVFAKKELRDLIDIKIFIDADSDERLCRRIKRDTAERGRTIDSVITQYLQTVKPMYNKYISPNKQYADIIIKSGLNDVAYDVISNQINHVLYRS
ncbi:uridine kinase [Lachnospiraceae bacterium KM106-2]|nr:uridine kinase [Lachnospiraceae bacterium KM106-2]